MARVGTVLRPLMVVSAWAFILLSALLLIIVMYLRMVRSPASDQRTRNEALRDNSHMRDAKHDTDGSADSTMDYVYCLNGNLIPEEGEFDLPPGTREESRLERNIHQIYTFLWVEILPDIYISLG